MTGALPSPLNDAWAAAFAVGASDLHLHEGQSPVWRRAGRLEVAPLPTLHLTESQLRHALGDSAWGVWDDPDWGRARWQRGRAETGWTLVARLLPQRIPCPAEVQLSPPLCALMTATQGLLLVTGATGSGKTSTLAALIQHWRTHQSGHVLTLEDPIEFVYPPGPGLITQRTVGRDVVDGATGLREALRQDPDLILLGELRDRETAELALMAAETGHLVLATLHARHAASALDRLLGLFDPAARDLARQQLADSLIAVLAQQLVWRGSHAQACREVLIGTPAVRHLIREAQLTQLESIQQTQRSCGMRTAAQAAAELTWPD